MAAAGVCGCQGRGLFLRGAGVPAPMQRVPSPPLSFEWNVGRGGRWWRGKPSLRVGKKKEVYQWAGALWNGSHRSGAHAHLVSPPLAAQLTM